MGQDTEVRRERGNPELPSTVAAGAIEGAVARKEPAGRMLSHHGLHVAHRPPGEKPSFKVVDMNQGSDARQSFGALLPIGLRPSHLFPVSQAAFLT